MGRIPLLTKNKNIYPRLLRKIFFKIKTLHKKCCELYLYCITICRLIHYAKPLIMEVFDLVGLTFGIGGFGSNTFNVDILEIIDSFFRWRHTWSIPFIMFSDYYHNFNTYFKYIEWQFVDSSLSFIENDCLYKNSLFL